MFTKLAVFALGLVAATEGASITQENGDIPAASEAARNLLHHSRRVQDNGQYGQYNEDYDFSNVDTTFLTGYSVKFQGCHHVQQWNDEAEEEDDVRIMTKRLVRYRMCPAADCSSDSMAGCSSKYGDYIVDMETYMESYLESIQQQYGGERQLQDNQQGGYYNGNYNMADFMECKQFDMRRHLQDNGEQYGYYQQEDFDYYVGPYCADQGGEIRLGLFTDDTCSTFAQNQYMIQGMPYTQSSMVSTSCVSCGQYGAVSEFCDSIYDISGKCESKMDMYYPPNEAGCSYIEGVKIIREDGVIRTSATKKSKAASIAIGSFLTVAVLLSAYVYYLRTSKYNQSFPFSPFTDGST